jgi:hypothetical protein
VIAVKIGDPIEPGGSQCAAGWRCGLHGLTALSFFLTEALGAGVASARSPTSISRVRRITQRKLDVGVQDPRLDQRLGPILKVDGAASVAAPDRQRNLTPDHPAVGSLAEPQPLSLPNDCVVVAKVAERWRSGIAVFGCHPRVTIARLNGVNGELTTK